MRRASPVGLVMRKAPFVGLITRKASRVGLITRKGLRAREQTAIGSETSRPSAQKAQASAEAAIHFLKNVEIEPMGRGDSSEAMLEKEAPTKAAQPTT